MPLSARLRQQPQSMTREKSDTFGVDYIIITQGCVFHSLTTLTNHQGTPAKRPPRSSLCQVPTDFFCSKPALSRWRNKPQCLARSPQGPLAALAAWRRGMTWMRPYNDEKRKEKSKNASWCPRVLKIQNGRYKYLDEVRVRTVNQPYPRCSSLP